MKTLLQKDYELTFQNEKQCIATIDKIIHINIHELFLTPTVEDCFTVIKNLTQIFQAVLAVEPKKYHEKTWEILALAREIIVEILHNAIDINERHIDTYRIDEEFLNASEFNIYYAKTIIRNAIDEYYGDVCGGFPEYMLNIYRSVAKPIYNEITQIEIEGEVVDSLEDVQSYLNAKALEYIYCEDDLWCSISIKLTLIDELKVFSPIKLNIDMDCDLLEGTIDSLLSDFFCSYSTNEIFDYIEPNKEVAE
jgi:hypothetical protein